MPAGIEIRDLRPDEALDVARLWLESARAAGQVGVEAATVEHNRWRLLNEPWECCVAWQGDAPMGFLAVQPQDRWLRQIFIAPEMFGQGLGTQLLDRAKQRMTDGFFLHTDLENLRARRFYEARGLVRDPDVVLSSDVVARARYIWKGL